MSDCAVPSVRVWSGAIIGRSHLLGWAASKIRSASEASSLVSTALTAVDRTITNIDDKVDCLNSLEHSRIRSSRLQALLKR